MTAPLASTWVVWLQQSTTCTAMVRQIHDSNLQSILQVFTLKFHHKICKKELWKVKKIYEEEELFLFNFLLLFFVAIFRNNLQGPEARKYSTR